MASDSLGCTKVNNNRGAEQCPSLETGVYVDTNYSSTDSRNAPRSLFCLFGIHSRRECQNSFNQNLITWSAVHDEYGPETPVYDSARG
ncbi:hypothetical protein HFX_3009 [Haloferax mediterranei ATCC 33500]|uniref:Uncharacterized protein n=1 Tax=Haloferax mediterranei (strain ATCC 33500 / DSM 1411 / JCM 8866 / NBRC 14739 / NCIMB 2177 / R-4) TaxID=523841 RepID=I3R8W3_HALMT|nr:hypothetical protein HFX_3009 [Haloferax mediterranei ATCC 33500]